MKTDGSTQAFPVPAKTEDVGHYGMTKREHFAALALQGLLACPEGAEGPIDHLFSGLAGFDGLTQNYSRVAVRYADALIAALNE